MTTEIYSISALDSTAKSTISDLQRHAVDTGFPEIDPYSMSDAEREQLCDYLRRDDGSLSQWDQEYMSEIADEIEDL